MMLDSPDRHFLSEHGFSLLVENEKGERVLIDAGASEQVLMHNLGLLGLKPESINAVFISHGHYDHVGGLVPLIKAGVPIFAHPRTFAGKRYILQGTKRTDLSVPMSVVEALKDARLNLSASSIELAEGIKTSGEIPRQYPFEGPGTFIREEDGKVVEDNNIDDQAVYVTSKKGLIVISGCGHAGIVNIVQQAKKSTGTKVFMAMGGFHLYSGDTDRLLKTMDHLKNLGVDHIAPMHCTGFEAMKLLSDRFVGFELMSVGCEMSIQ
ncbi:MAG: MBL fold metallo-hydrolase [Methanomassiliicoccales archaeon]|nr:MBL fold metallo-hydrolase [Methanomassiliicoccales archaeon]